MNCGSLMSMSPAVRSYDARCWSPKRRWNSPMQAPPESVDGRFLGDRSGQPAHGTDDGGQRADLGEVLELERTLAAGTGRAPLRRLDGIVQRGLVAVPDRARRDTVSDHAAAGGEATRSERVDERARLLEVILERLGRDDGAAPL